MHHEHEANDQSVPTEPQHALRHLPTVRSENPELWDLEREYERRRTEQLDEVWAKSARLVRLMDRVEALEPLPGRLAERERELAAAREVLGALQRAHGTLEEQYRASADALRTSEENWRAERADTERLKAEVERLGRELEHLTTMLHQREDELVEQGRRYDALLAHDDEEHKRFESEMAEAERRLEEAEARRANSEAERDARIAALADEVRGRDTTIEQKHRWAESLAAELDVARSEIANRSTQLAERDGDLRRVESELASVRLERDADVRRLERELADLRAQREVDARRFADELAESRRERESETRMLGDELAAARAERDATAAALERSRGEHRELEATWRTTLEQLELARAERRKHDGHLAATLAALTEIRPMISALENKLQAQAEVADATPRA
ncbi:MAG: hypothetical protein L6Q99_03570 [Planctomycetes bacterium]|nr:hypothetical protein [Planctomycetota bacterium]